MLKHYTRNKSNMIRKRNCLPKFFVSTLGKQFFALKLNSYQDRTCDSSVSVRLAINSTAINSWASTSAGLCESTCSYNSTTENYATKTNAESPSRSKATETKVTKTNAESPSRSKATETKVTETKVTETKAEERLKSTQLGIRTGLQQISSLSTQYKLLQHFAPRVIDILTQLFLPLLCIPLKANDKNDKTFSLYYGDRTFLGSRGIFDELLANQLSKMPGRSSTTAKVVRDANYRSEKQVKRSNTALNRVHAVLSRNAFSRCCEE